MATTRTPLSPEVRERVAALRKARAEADRVISDKVLPVIGNAISERREHLGLSQRALAEQAGVDRVFLRGLESGESAPTVVVLAKLAGPLKTTVSALTKGI